LNENKTQRLFSDKEIEKLDTVCRDFILFLEQTTVMNAFDREIVIDRLMALEAEDIDIQQLKWGCADGFIKPA